MHEVSRNKVLELKKKIKKITKSGSEELEHVDLPYIKIYCKTESDKDSDLGNCIRCQKPKYDL